MTRRAMAAYTAVACGASLVVVPALVLLVRMVFGPGEAAAIWAGSTISTIFFASTALVGLATWHGDDPRSSIVGTYAVKVSLLIIAGIALSPLGLDGGAFAAGAVSSAFSYLFVQVVAVTRDGKDRNQ